MTFDEDHLVANAGVLLVATMARGLGIGALVDAMVKIPATRGGFLPGRKVLTLVQAMVAGATHIDHVRVELDIRDLNEGVGLAHCPPGNVPANGAWLLCAVLAHNLLLPSHWPWQSSFMRTLASLRALPSSLIPGGDDSAKRSGGSVEVPARSAPARRRCLPDWRAMGRRVLGLVLALAGIVALGLGAGACGGAATPVQASPGAWTPVGRVVPDSDLTGVGAFLGPVRQVTVGDITMGYRHFGRGPQLVMVTGDTAPMSLWTPQLLRNLARSFSVTIFDNRGVGYTSDDLSHPITVPAMADDTAGLIRVLHLGRPILLGWSMGGEIGLTVAVRHPHALSKLVTTGADFGGRQALQAPAAVVAELNDPSTTPEQFLSLIFPPSAHQAVAAFVHQYLSVPQEKVSARTLLRQGAAEEAWYRYEGTYNGLPRVSVPLLITNGTEDQVNPPGNARLIRRRIGHGTVTMFPGAGHAMLFQDTATFVADVRRFAGA